jgi:hypothetical protein
MRSLYGDRLSELRFGGLIELPVAGTTALLIALALPTSNQSNTAAALVAVQAGSAGTTSVPVFAGQAQGRLSAGAGGAGTVAVPEFAGAAAASLPLSAAGAAEMALLNWDIEYALNPAFTGSTLLTRPAALLSLTQLGLAAGTHYSRVRAVYSEGNSDWSATQTTVVSASVSGAGAATIAVGGAANGALNYPMPTIVRPAGGGDCDLARYNVVNGTLANPTLYLFGDGEPNENRSAGWELYWSRHDLGLAGRLPTFVLNFADWIESYGYRIAPSPWKPVWRYVGETRNAWKVFDNLTRDEPAKIATFWNNAAFIQAQIEVALLPLYSVNDILDYLNEYSASHATLISEPPAVVDFRSANVGAPAYAYDLIEPATSPDGIAVSGWNRQWAVSGAGLTQPGGAPKYINFHDHVHAGEQSGLRAMMAHSTRILTSTDADAIWQRTNVINIYSVANMGGMMGGMARGSCCGGDPGGPGQDMNRSFHINLTGGVTAGQENLPQADALCAAQKRNLGLGPVGVCLSWHGSYYNGESGSAPNFMSDFSSGLTGGSSDLAAKVRLQASVTNDGNAWLQGRSLYWYVTVLNGIGATCEHGYNSANFYGDTEASAAAWSKATVATLQAGLISAGNSSAIASVTAAATGTGAGPNYSGTINVALPITAGGAGAALAPGFAGSAAAAVPLVATGAGTSSVPGVTGLASGVLTVGGLASGNRTLPQTNGSAAAAVALVGQASGTAVVPGVAGAGAAGLTLVVGGAGTISIPGFAGMTATVLPLGAVAAGITAVPLVAGIAAAGLTVGVSASGSVIIAGIAGAASATLVPSALGVGTYALPQASGSGTAAVGLTAQASGTSGVPGASGAGAAVVGLGANASGTRFVPNFTGGAAAILSALGNSAGAIVVPGYSGSSAATIALVAAGAGLSTLPGNAGMAGVSVTLSGAAAGQYLIAPIVGVASARVELAAQGKSRSLFAAPLPPRRNPRGGKRVRDLTRRSPVDVG